MSQEPGAIEENIQQQQVENVEVAIVMDVTGSMQKWIDIARDTVLQSFATLQSENPNSQFKLACVCYRDIGDENPFVVLPFTTDLHSVQNSLRNTRAVGGDDTAEDIAGALEQVLNLQWCVDPNASRVVLWVADAPAHGTKYHSATVGDRFPKGDPQNREPSEQVRELAMRDIDLTVFRVDNSIDKMIEVFSGVYESVNNGSTFTLLDIARQEKDLAPPPPLPSLSSSASIFSSDLTSGYIDLASYDEDVVYRGGMDGSSHTSHTSPTPAPCALSSSESFEYSTYSAVRKAVARKSGSSSSS